MSDRAKKKEKHRLKRLSKQRAARKEAAVSPLRRIAAEGGTLECWANAGWAEEGLASLLVFGTDGSGKHALCGFLVDVWAVGLKDAWGRAPAARADWDETFGIFRSEVDAERIDVAEVRRLVAGGVRFARQNGFRLPNGWDKWAAMLGPLGDLNTADLTGFTKDGKLLYVGDERFLRQRLINMTPQQFAAQPGVDWVIQQSIDYSEDDAEGGDLGAGFDDLDEELDDMIEEAAPDLLAAIDKAHDRASDSVLAWCRARGQQPNPRLDDALHYFVTLAVSAMALQASGLSVPPAGDLRPAIEDVIARNHEPDPASLAPAIDQVFAWLADTDGGRLEALLPAPA